MKLLATAALLAAVVPATPSGPWAGARHEDPGARHGTPGDCAHPEARLRTGTHGTERNELSPAQAATVEQHLNRILDGLHLTPANETDGVSDGADLRKAAQISVPVYFHVLHDGAKGNVSTAEIKRQISTLNASYGGRNGGANTRVSFKLKTVSRTDNAAWFSDPERYEGTYKPKLHKGGKGTLNLYSAYIGGDLLGWSTFPWKYKSDPKMDGVTVHYASMPGGSIEHFNKGFSATHEVGHWLGLYHTFQDGCTGKGDRVSDTPAERDPTNGCPSGKDTCPAQGNDPVHNYMDYSYDTCMTSFTAGQGSRIHKAWTAYRA
ncbi:zinc metalloprotease [Actinomadura darangshiensis]|uniref:Zinc metalloprotease n=1 Tax=Actinomadura darangshiensis TaxID=705336 RepID=A0A4R5B7N5_9ACTN|nr:zinc metalloprotease [Actinomadura darangshiensis]TDD80949.1 zinc metalloprotease [Actinomadura darangshiensis]